MILGDIMIKKACSLLQIQERKNEIVNTVGNMLDTMDYQDISMKTISERISIARSSLYCYYKTKEEIMLDVLKDDYLIFVSELNECFFKQGDLASNITDVFLNHLKLLKIVSIHLVDIETHVSLENLIDFKKDFVKPFDNLFNSISTYFPNVDKISLNSFFNSILMLTHGLYPMIYPMEIQVSAMKAVGMSINNDRYSYCKNYINLLISGLNQNKGC